MALITLVIARSPTQRLDWLAALPAHVRVVVHEQETPVGSGEPEALDGLPEGSRRIALGRSCGAQMGSFLAHVLDPDVDHGEQHTVFCGADALRHAPALLTLLEDPRRWADVQPLSIGEAPADLIERDARDWIGPMPVRAERYSLATLAPLGWHDPDAADLAAHHRSTHALAAGESVMAHFLELSGLDALAAAARQADIGVMAHGPVFAVRGPRLTALRAQPGDALLRLQLLCRADPKLARLAERAVLHLCGLPMVRLEPLPRPIEERTPIGMGLSRVMASIDAVLARAEEPAPQAAFRNVAASAPSEATAADATDRPAGSATPSSDADAQATQATRREAVREAVRVAIAAGRPEEAMDLLQQAIQDDPSEVDLLGDAATLCFHRGDLAQAVPLARRALLRDPSHAESQFALAMSLAALGERVEAMVLFDSLVSADSARDFRGAHPDLTAVAERQTHHLHQIELQRRAATMPVMATEGQD
ncbi:tetratricopeptide repeat protein [Leptothrix discophora]|uniref:Tetratricopeptide repeat protein n=1 Tax=Leptothrix discophora TaxID=89 RepID=A0ABT9G6C4_LEPDI|nr:tetratricopeptide repeat protein [Leptothrix discophora]MDP4302038.1 tetratricopeptide repeat protein [Leptothrix discophora]